MSQATHQPTSAGGGWAFGGLPTWYDYIDIAPEKRPSMREKVKDKKYDLACARYYLGRTRALQVNWMRMCTAINEGFASGMLWGLQPDLQSYLMDKGVRTTRQPFQFNLFTPLLARQLGLLAQIDINARAQSATQRSTSRREAQIMRATALARGAMAGGENVRGASAAMGIVADDVAAADIADKNFQDPVIKPINSIMTMVAIDSGIEEMRKHVGQAISNSGLGAVHCYFNGSKVCLEAMDPGDVVVDSNAKRPDLTDSEFVAVCPLRDIADLMEQYNGSRELLKQLEDTVEQGRMQMDPRAAWPQGRPRPFVLYYKDGDYVTRGFILGPNGPELVTIDEIDELTGKPRYTEADLIDPPDGYDTSGWTGKTSEKFVVKGRYCVFIPREYCPATKTGDGSADNPVDLVLANGECKLIETDPERTNSIKFPVKLGAWMNIKGYIISPLTAAQSPQRVMNILTSDIVHRISKASGRSVILGKRSLAGAGGTVKQAAQNLKNSDPIEVDEMVGGSVSNAIGMAGEGLDPNIFKEFELLGQLKTIVEGVTQLYDQNFGASGSANELVGVKRLQWQQSSVAQHPYHEAFKSIMRQVYEWVANVARRHLMQYPAVLEDMVGEKDMKTLLSIQDMMIEQVRVHVVLSPNAELIKQAVDEMVLTQLLPSGLLGPVEAAQSLGSSYPEEVYERSRRYTQDKAMAAAEQAKAQQNATAMEALNIREGEAIQREHDLYNKMLDIGVKSDATNAKSEMPMRAAVAEAIKPPQAA